MEQVEDNKQYRIEKDTLGEVRVPIDRYYGPQTQRSYMNFPIGKQHEQMPMEIIEAFAVLKLACAKANHKLNKDRMTKEKCDAIESVCNKILKHELDQEFPLVVFQTGSGTQTNMNVNEVIANYTNMHCGKSLLHPNDDVNMSQSSNDTFPTAMHIAGVLAIQNNLIPSIKRLIDTMYLLEKENQDVVKIGRTHLQDAVPISFAQEISGWRNSLEVDLDMIEQSILPLSKLAIGGTAVGTGLNAPKNFDFEVCNEITSFLDVDFLPSRNKFHALTSLSEFVNTHGCIKALAMDLMKIANDIRHLASGPRCGLNELIIPANEPGSSIMPGKVNPTQCEQLTQVAVRVFGNDASIGFAASQGNFELNVYLPITAYSFLQSVRLLSDSIDSFNTRCVKGIKPNYKKMDENLHQSLMLCTILSPYIGYEKAAHCAHVAHMQHKSLKEVCLELGYMEEDMFDKVFKPEEMI